MSMAGELSAESISVDISSIKLLTDKSVCSIFSFSSALFCSPSFIAFYSLVTRAALACG